MVNELPYKSVINLAIDVGDIKYRVNNRAGNQVSYIIDFPGSGIISLSTIIDSGLSDTRIKECVSDAIIKSQQGLSFVELNYLRENLAIIDCVDYSVDLDVNAYLVYMKLTDDTEIYGAIRKGYTLSEVSLFITKRRTRIGHKDTAALEKLKAFEKNVMGDRRAK